MKVSIKWLREYVDIALPIADLAKKLTMAGIEATGLQFIGGDWDNIFVGQITAVNPHPNADRLSLVTINLGAEQQTAVTGAPNIRLGDKVAFARVGAQLIDGHTGEKFRLKPAKIRGVVSNGMACSEKELGISDSHEGIMVLPPDAPLGVPIAEYLGDTILDLEVTPNRADCLSVIGIAREVSALTGQSLHIPEIKYEEATAPVDQQVAVEIIAPDFCPRYCASLVTSVKVAPSPDWMQHRLLSCGMRPINNVVDITNYVMLEYGQPLHAFDYERIKAKKIIVRRTRNYEKLVTLDGVERVLKEDMLVIADAERAVALAGVMGGADSEVTAQTTSILLEAANFNPASIHHTGSALSLPSEARMRFERGIRPELTVPAIKRAAQLLVELAGGKAAKGVVDVYPGKIERKPIRISTADVKRFSSIELNSEQLLTTLTSLGFDCKRGDSSSEAWATPPYWRNDINLTVDLVEEVVRIIGYDKIPVTMLSQPIPRQNPDPILNLKRQIRYSLLGYGFQEIISYSLTGLESLSKLLPESQALGPLPLRLANPMTAGQEYLRTSLRANLLDTFSVNRRHENGEIRLFEMGRVYVPRPKDLPDERETLCGLLCSPRTKKSWHGESEDIDFFDAKGIVEGLLSQLGVAASFEKSEDPSLRSNRQATVVIADKKLGVVGELHPKVLHAFEISEAVYLFELDVTALLPFAEGLKKFQPIPKFPAVLRDIALVVDITVTHRQIHDIISSFALVKETSLFDVYSGEQVPPGKKSLAFKLTFQSPDHTLTDEEADKVQQQILNKLAKEFGAALRT